MSENYPLNCQRSKDQLDSLIEAMVEARLNVEADDGIHSSSSSFEPDGALKEHLADCSECHNYHLANRVIIEAARALPKLQGDEALTQSILAAIEISDLQLAEVKRAVPVPAQSMFTPRSALILVASFVAFILTSSGFSVDALWSVCSWSLALMMVALLKPLIEGNVSLTSPAHSMAKA